MLDVRAAIPLDDEPVTPLHHRPGIGADHRNTAERPELRRLVVGQRRDLDHLLDALHLERLGGIEGLHLAAIDRRPRHDGDLHAGHADVGAVGGAARAHVVVVDHRHVAADVLPLRLVLQLRRGIAGRHLDVGGCVHHLAEVEPLARARVVEAVVLRVDLARVDAPFLGRRLLQHVARGRAQLAHDLEVVAGAARAVGVLLVLAGRVELRLVARRLPYLHPLPVGFELVGQDHRDAGAHALTHLGTAARQRHRSVVGNLDEEVGLDRGAVALAARRRNHGTGGDVGAEHDGAGDAGGLQEGTPADVLHAQHDQTSCAAVRTAEKIRW